MRGKDIWITLLVGIGLFAAGYHYKSRLARKESFEEFSQIDAQNALSQASDSARVLESLNNNRLSEAERTLKVIIKVDVAVVEANSSKGGGDAIERGKIDKPLWKKQLQRIRDCAARNELPETVKRADDILRWLEQDSLSKK